jgi:hypothetical protein
MEQDGAPLTGELVKRWLKLSTLAVVLLAAAPGAWATVYVRIEAPAIRVETHEERHGYVWQSGYWRWQGQRHEWIYGHYAQEKHGHHWRDGRWEHSDRGYYWVGGSWVR